MYQVGFGGDSDFAVSQISFSGCFKEELEAELEELAAGELA